MTVKDRNGFSALELMVTLLAICILTAFSIRPVSGFLQRIKLQNSADGIKQLILTARIRAVANPSTHCGVVFRVHTSATTDDTVFAFLESNPPDYAYTSKDSVYGKPFVVEKKYKITAAIPSGYPSVFVFRGDGSANASAKLSLTLKNFNDSVTVLASTGKVKVTVK